MGGATEPRRSGLFDSVVFSMLLRPPHMSRINRSSSLRASLLVCLTMLLLALAPFAVAQDVHHELAAADHDGHEHSDNDLCQWVQHHTAGSLDTGAPILVAGELVRLAEYPADSVLLSVEPSSFDPSRAPPRR
jgi:hypothetical protein